ncbi:acetate--CoA ligase family protein [Desulfopila sp. IMCC35008]|uniref:acetate--CoA ligase family protein n=1 Tax=Desulfopila sp. IMCC35008 TaxID=2653858 RepID=UPI0013D89C27|nr:acetate--CoA ligase family protein [Desulfopila sp. IMCC35008]
MRTQEIRSIIDAALASTTGVISEVGAKQVFRALDMPVVEERVVNSVEDVSRAAGQIGYPVVLKGGGSKILHKTESGLVQIGLTNETEVRDAALKMLEKSGDTVEQFLIQPMVRGKREFVAGVFRDPLFGPVVLFGLGGIYTEVLNDTVIRIAPLSESDIDAMLDEIHAVELLGEFRGEKSVDRSSLQNILQALSDLCIKFPEVKEVDINPLLIDANGTPVAVDGLIIVEQEKKVKEERGAIDARAFRACFYPKSVAFVGASGTIAKWGHSLVANVLRRDFQGEVYLVNPRGGELMGRAVYTSVADIENSVDLAVVTIPARFVMDLLPQLREKGVKAMLLITSGFRETGEEGARLEEQLVLEAEKNGIVIFGPNTMGICNPSIDFFCCGVHVYPKPGPTVLVCQSGNMGTQLLAFAEQQEIGIRAFSGSGNEAMVTIEDYLEMFEDDEDTRTVVLYVESIKDGQRFFHCAKRVSNKKPVVILKGGRTGKGGEAASSHTGAIASDSRVFDAVCEQAGIVQVQQPMELLDLSAVFSSLPLPKGNRVAIMTLGGGWGVITTDLCLELGLAVPDIPEEIVHRLDSILPSYWSRNNPVDIVGENDPNIPSTAIAELAKWDGCDAVIHLGIHGKKLLANRMFDSVAISDPRYSESEIAKIKKMVGGMEDAYVQHVVQLTEKYNKPILGVSLLTEGDLRTLYTVDHCSHKGVFFPSPERAVRALAGMWQYRQWLMRQ